MNPKNKSSQVPANPRTISVNSINNISEEEYEREENILKNLMIKNVKTNLNYDEYKNKYYIKCINSTNTLDDCDLCYYENNCELCYENNVYYIVFNCFATIYECSICGHDPICNTSKGYCRGSLSSDKYVEQYFIAPILVNNKNSALNLFDEFIKIIDLYNFNHTEFKIKLRLLDIIMNSKFNNIFIKEIGRYIISFLVDDSKLIEMLINFKK
jgi:hypothetical protein